MTIKKTAEHKRLEDYRARRSNWKQWGPYLSDRSWGTVREDYSEHGAAWDYFPHDHARSRAYRWGEDGLGGISDRYQYLCFALSLWNGKDGILKERFFGLNSHEGNHGEDVKDYYFYLDSTPTHSYMKMLYKYPHAVFPYTQLVEENRHRSRHEGEFELVDTKIFDENRYFDVFIEYAKADQEDILIKFTIANRGPEAAPVWVVPNLWFRNTWGWGYPNGPMKDVSGIPSMRALDQSKGFKTIEAKHPTLGDYYLYAEGDAELLFTENETNSRRFQLQTEGGSFFKDAFHEYLIDKNQLAVNPAQTGSKSAACYTANVGAGKEVSFRLRLSSSPVKKPFSDFDKTFSKRVAEADEFYDTMCNAKLTEEERSLQRQALGGMLWSKQLYYYDLEQWISGDPNLPPLSAGRNRGRNSDWQHLTNFDIISMPDKWEYPWYAAWDLAFHGIALALVDPDFAKRQLELMTREWYMHPNGQLPAYEWAFGDVNPPVHAWAAWRIYKIDRNATGKADTRFLEGVFHKLLLNFTWWVNRKDEEGHNIFQGGFLGLDNIGVFDRSAPLPTGGYIDQADGTSWMAAYSLTMMEIALELAKTNPVYQDSASKFLEHFLRIAHAMTDIGGNGYALWDENDGFFYDLLHLPDSSMIPLKIRSLVGLIPLFAVDTIEPSLLEQMPDFARRLNWFVTNRSHLAGNMARIDTPGVGQRRLVAILTKDRLVRVLQRMLDETEFLSDFGIRSLSRYHENNPFQLHINNELYQVNYDPAESTSAFFGGNSNWRGPVWFPINFLIIESLQKFHHYYGDELQVEYPRASGKFCNLEEVATDLSQRLTKLFLRDENNNRPFNGDKELFQKDPNWKDNFLFHEYFHPETGLGLGASHQTGWTGLVAKLLQQSGGKKDI